MAHYNLGNALRTQRKPKEAIDAYRTAIQIKPDYAEAHTNLGIALHDQEKLEEAVAEYRTAIRLKPDDVAAHGNLGNALRAQGKLEEAIAEHRTAIRLKPDDAMAHNNLGNALHAQGKLEEAIDAYRTAIRLKPDHAESHTNFGIVLRAQGKLEEAIAEHRTAIRIKPDYALAYFNLGNALHAQGKLKEAIAEWRTTIRIKPDYALAYFNLGNALRTQRKSEEAIDAYRTAIGLKPDYAEAHCNLGLLLKRQGKFAEALAELRSGHELGSKRPNWRFPSAQWVRDAELAVALAARLPAVLKGDDAPKDAAEGLAFAKLCYDTGRHSDATRLYSEALKADRNLAEDRQAHHRYAAACAAALAGCGQGKDVPPPNEAARAGLRTQARDWLRAELAAWSKLIESGPPQARPVIVKTLRHWKADSDLAGIRDESELKKLHEGEQTACRALWADVDAVLGKARIGTAP
jgi:tetratricopeptide (TPR) repeat protein